MFAQILCILAVIVIFLIWLQNLFCRRNSFGVDLPGPKSYPLIGSSYLFFRKDHCETFEIVSKHFAQYPKFFKYILGLRRVICLTDPDLIQHALTSTECQNKAFMYKFFDVDYGLISASYHDWKQYRKILNPAFNRKILVRFISIFEKCSQIMTERMSTQVDCGEFDVFQFASNATLQMICQSSLGSAVAAQPQTAKFCLFLDQLLSLMSQRWFKVAFHNDWLYALTPMYRKTQRLRSDIQEIIEPIITEKRDFLRQQKQFMDISEKEFDRKPMIFVDQLLKMERDGQEITIPEIQCHIYTIIAAGNETSALQTSYIFLMLAMFSDVQQKVYEEITNIYSKSGRQQLSYEALQQQHYLELVIKETMRLFPVAPIIGREAIEPVRLGEMNIPPGTTLLMNFYALHRRQDLWGPDADQFNPERFREENSASRHPFCYFPFGGGPRVCIGYRYAMLSVKAMVTHVVKEYHLRTRLKLNELRPSHEITLKLPSGFMMSIEKRNRNAR
ncbi:probable cytochrome P450 313a4 isoform X2 [Wyeomyia smithii]|uniref:probable cytochrome P450 313a4 isoform X2 n=1 Tax=Wyeomyia smithii TaxID=174621 RepID=UPI002467B6E4|nr:probable cytochrome P450 313a4 isoform X2 [Wyeomyia smithii]